MVRLVAVAVAFTTCMAPVWVSVQAIQSFMISSEEADEKSVYIQTDSMLILGSVSGIGVVTHHIHHTSHITASVFDSSDCF